MQVNLFFNKHYLLVSKGNPQNPQTISPMKNDDSIIYNHKNVGGVSLKNRYGIKKNGLLHNGHRYNKDQNFEWRYLDMDIEHQSIISHWSVNFQTKNPPIFTRFGGSNPIISCSTHMSVFHTVVTWGRGLRHIHNGLTQGITLGFLVTEIIK